MNPAECSRAWVVRHCWVVRIWLRAGEWPGGLLDDIASTCELPWFDASTAGGGSA